MAQGQSQTPPSNPQADPEQERVSGTQLDTHKKSPRKPDPQDRGEAQHGSRPSGTQERPQAGGQDTQKRSGGQ